MTWARHLTFVLAVGAPDVNSASALNAGMFVDQVSFADARTALKSGSYGVLLIDPAGNPDEAMRLARFVHQAKPDVRLIWIAHHAEPEVPVRGELIVAANGRQLL